jgi:hypothetical protein
LPASAEAPDHEHLRDRDRLSALDELFHSTTAYLESGSYFELMKFISRFPKYAPFNCFLLHMQNPKLTYVATPFQWHSRFGRAVSPGARPLVILAPMQPVAFVYDLEDTTGDRLPPELDRPFKTDGHVSVQVWDRTSFNCAERDLIDIRNSDFSRLRAGRARVNTDESVLIGSQRRVAKYIIELNQNHTREEKYATLVHELAHIYSGHLGGDPDGWWPGRSSLSRTDAEFEAESVSFLVCRRLRLETPAAQYLARYLESEAVIPRISLETVLKVTAYIESLGQKELQPRKARAENNRVKGPRPAVVNSDAATLGSAESGNASPGGQQTLFRAAQGLKARTLVSPAKTGKSARTGKEGKGGQPDV